MDTQSRSGRKNTSLEPIYQNGITPGQEYAWIVLVLLSLFFMISLFKVKTK